MSPEHLVIAYIVGVIVALGAGAGYTDARDPSFGGAVILVSVFWPVTLILLVAFGVAYVPYKLVRVVLRG